jgi:hypothetical protein
VPPTRLVGPTSRSAGLRVGRTHLSGTAMSLVGGDLGVPMSHTKTFHVPNMNLKIQCKLLGKCAPMSYVLNLICFGC